MNATLLTGSYPGGTYCNLTPGATITVCQPPRNGGNLTVVADNIIFPNNLGCNNAVWPDGNYRQTLNGNQYGLMVYATGSSLTALDFQGNGSVFPADSLGFFFVPNGGITMEKNNGANGFWEAMDINVQFNNFSMQGFGPSGEPASTTVAFTTTITTPTVINGTTRGNSTSTSVSTGTTTGPGAVSTGQVTTPTSISGLTVPGTSQTVTSGVSTDLGLRQ
jgi:hypothetical protein